MNQEQLLILRTVFEGLSEQQKDNEILALPYTTKMGKLFSKHEIISANIGSKVENSALFIGYSGVINVLYVANNEVVMKPNLIRQIINSSSDSSEAHTR